MSDWKPIETAPRESAEVLLWVPDLGARPANFLKGRWESPVTVGIFYDDATHWREPIEGPQ